MVNSKVINAGIWYTIANFASNGLAFLSAPIFIRLLSKSDVGAFANLASWMAILGGVTSLSLYTSVNAAFFDYGKDKLDDHIASNLIFGSVITTLLYIIAFFYKEYVLAFLTINDFEFNLMFASLMFAPAMQMFQIKNRILYRYKTTVAISLFSSFASVLIALVLVYVMNNKLLGREIGCFGFGIIINCIIYIYFVLKKQNLSIKYCKYALAISVPLLVHAFSITLLNASDRVMITKFCGNEFTAMYSVAHSGAVAVSILWSSMNTAWSPWAYEQMAKQNFDLLNNASKPYILFFIFCAGAVLLFAPEVLLFMGGQQYLEAVYVIPPVLMGFIFQFVYSLYFNIEYFYKNQRCIAMATIIAALLNIILNYIFIPLFGYIAAAYTTLVGYMVLFAIHFLVVNKMGKNFYDSKFIWNVLIVSFISCILMLYVYSSNLLRCLLMVISLLLLIVVIVKLREGICLAFHQKSIEPIWDELRRKGFVKA